MSRKPKTDGYSVRDILEYKQENGQEYLLIWWRSYARRNATWQPKENIQHLHDFYEYYQKLKQTYHQKMKKKEKVEEEDEKPVQKKSKASGKRKTKKIEKEVKKTNSISDGQHSSSQDKHSPQEQNHKQEAPPVPEKINSNNNLAINNSLDGLPPPQDNDNNNINLGRPMTKDKLKHLIRNAPPVQFQIKIKQFKDLPLAGHKLRRIKQSFIQKGNVMYHIELQNKAALQQPLIIHEDLLQVLWPRTFADYLCSHRK